MKFACVKNLDEEKFRRLTGVKRTIFDKITGVSSLNDGVMTPSYFWESVAVWLALFLR
jgi:hypothetical protein